MDWKVSLSAVAALLLLSGAARAEGVDAYKLDPSFIKGKHPIHVKDPSNPTLAGRHAANAAVLADGMKNAANNHGGIPGVDSIVNFTGSFNTPGLDPTGTVVEDKWFYSMVGNFPNRDGDGVTHIGAPLVPVTVELLDADGDQAFDPASGARLILGPHAHVRDVLQSPVFEDYQFTSSRKETQFTDAVARATFFHSAGEDWHTLLDTWVADGLTLKVPMGAYQYALNNDGSCCAFMLLDYNTFNALLFPPTFPVDHSTLMGKLELNGVATTKRITTLLFQDIYLYIGTVANCCVLGFHGPDEEPGTAHNGNRLRLYMMNYASWISPGLFGTPELGLEDITALSHEMAETFNDPFVVFDGVHNLTPWWLSGSQCQDDLEVGDVIEGLPTDVTFPMAGRNGFLYHPQNVALLQWFAFQSHSTALGGAYSYPDPGSLPALSPQIQPVFDSSGNLIACNPTTLP